MELLFDLERKLHRSELRKDSGNLAALLAPSFFEFGSSGRIWHREETITSLHAEEPSKVEATEFKAHKLAETVYLITYRSKRTNSDGSSVEALRSSIWRKNKGEWQMQFHQGTKIP